MTSEIKREGNTVEFEIDIDAQRLEEAMQSIYNEEKHNFQLPGFRKGKVPRQLLEANYGQDLFFQDGLNKILPEIIQEAIDENDIQIAGQPSVDLKEYYEKGQDLTVIVEVDVMPEFEVEGYKDMDVEKVVYQVTEEMLDNELESEKMQNARSTIIEDRPIEAGDQVLIDYTGFVDGEEFQGGSAEDHELTIGSGQFIPGFEEGLIGAETGQELEIELTFPEDYHAEDLAGKDTVFDVLVKEIREIEYPEIDDEFIKDISEYDTVEEFKANSRARLEDEFKNRSETETRQKLVEQVKDLVDIDIPQPLIEQQIDNEMRNFLEQLSSQGIDVSQFIGDDINELRENFRPQAESNLKTQLVLDQIAEQEGIEVTDADIDEELNRAAKMYMPEDDQEEDRKEFIKRMKEDSSMVEASIKERKTINLLEDNANFIEVSEEESLKEEDADEDQAGGKEE